ncbi:hypothetical protein CLOM_g22901 [Closterium sp. NIES-68]|nr:hypothetical protein CLOM_g22901 [Closterium sp. NIES-68]GJP85423.1 hypothetical protein CLOP_g15534 [Closterium sp. NIES-67]
MTAGGLTMPLGITRCLPVAEYARFALQETAQALWTALEACYSSPSSAALGRLSLPFLFPDLASSSTVADLVEHLRDLKVRYRAAWPEADLATHLPSTFLALYLLTNRLPDRLAPARNTLLALSPTALTID